MLLAAEDTFLVDIYLAHIMEQRADSDALQGELCIQLRFHADNLLPEHDGCLIDVHGVLGQAALTGQVKMAGSRGLEEAELFELGDYSVDTFALGAEKNCEDLFFCHILSLSICRKGKYYRRTDNSLRL